MIRRGYGEETARRRCGKLSQTMAGQFLASFLACRKGLWPGFGLRSWAFRPQDPAEPVKSAPTCMSLAECARPRAQQSAPAPAPCKFAGPCLKRCCARGRAHSNAEHLPPPVRAESVFRRLGRRCGRGGLLGHLASRQCAGRCESRWPSRASARHTAQRRGR